MSFQNGTTSHDTSSDLKTNAILLGRCKTQRSHADFYDLGPSRLLRGGVKGFQCDDQEFPEFSIMRPIDLQVTQTGSLITCQLE